MSAARASACDSADSSVEATPPGRGPRIQRWAAWILLAALGALLAALPSFCDSLYSDLRYEELGMRDDARIACEMLVSERYLQLYDASPCSAAPVVFPDAVPTPNDRNGVRLGSDAEAALGPAYRALTRLRPRSRMQFGATPVCALDGEGWIVTLRIATRGGTTASVEASSLDGCVPHSPE